MYWYVSKTMWIDIANFIELHMHLSNLCATGRFPFGVSPIQHVSAGDGWGCAAKDTNWSIVPTTVQARVQNNLAKRKSSSGCKSYIANPTIRNRACQWFLSHRKTAAHCRKKLVTLPECILGIWIKTKIWGSKKKSEDQTKLRARMEGRKEGRKEWRKEGRKEGRKGGREGGSKEGREGGRKEGRKGGRKEGRKEGNTKNTNIARKDAKDNGKK